MIYLPNGVNIPFGGHVSKVGGHAGVKHSCRVGHPPRVKHAMVFTGVRQMHCVARVKPPPGGGQIGGCVSRQQTVWAVAGHAGGIVHTVAAVFGCAGAAATAS